jgi:hypothetical protein
MGVSKCQICMPGAFVADVNKMNGLHSYSNLPPPTQVLLRGRVRDPIFSGKGEYFWAKLVCKILITEVKLMENTNLGLRFGALDSEVSFW